MGKYSEYMEKKNTLAIALDWVSNKNKIDSQDGKAYVRIVSIDNDFLQFCGQSSAGANNYHKADDDFRCHIKKAVEFHFNDIIDKAVQYAQQDVKEAGILAKEEIESMLYEISELDFWR